MDLDNAKAVSSLGERLLEGVRNLWKEVHDLTRIADHHGAEIENLKARLKALESDVRGLRISRGRAKAKSGRLEAALAESESKIADIKAVLH